MVGKASSSTSKSSGKRVVSDGSLDTPLLGEGKLMGGVRLNDPESVTAELVLEVIKKAFDVSADDPSKKFKKIDESKCKKRRDILLNQMEDFLHGDVSFLKPPISPDQIDNLKLITFNLREGSKPEINPPLSMINYLKFFYVFSHAMESKKYFSKDAADHEIDKRIFGNLFVLSTLIKQWSDNVTDTSDDAKKVKAFYKKTCRKHRANMTSEGGRVTFKTDTLTKLDASASRQQQGINSTDVFSDYFLDKIIEKYVLRKKITVKEKWWVPSFSSPDPEQVSMKKIEAIIQESAGIIQGTLDKIHQGVVTKETSLVVPSFTAEREVKGYDRDGFLARVNNESKVAVSTTKAPETTGHSHDDIITTVIENMEKGAKEIENPQEAIERYKKTFTEAKERLDHIFILKGIHTKIEEYQTVAKAAKVAAEAAEAAEAAKVAAEAAKDTKAAAKAAAEAAAEAAKAAKAAKAADKQIQNIVISLKAYKSKTGDALKTPLETFLAHQRDDTISGIKTALASHIKNIATQFNKQYYSKDKGTEDKGTEFWLDLRLLNDLKTKLDSMNQLIKKEELNSSIDNFKSFFLVGHYKIKVDEEGRAEVRSIKKVNLDTIKTFGLEEFFDKDGILKTSDNITFEKMWQAYKHHKDTSPPTNRSRVKKAVFGYKSSELKHFDKFNKFWEDELFDEVVVVRKPPSVDSHKQFSDDLKAAALKAYNDHSLPCPIKVLDEDGQQKTFLFALKINSDGDKTGKFFITRKPMTDPSFKQWTDKASRLTRPIFGSEDDLEIVDLSYKTSDNKICLFSSAYKAGAREQKVRDSELKSESDRRRLESFFNSIGIEDSFDNLSKQKLHINLTKHILHTILSKKYKGFESSLLELDQTSFDVSIDIYLERLIDTLDLKIDTATAKTDKTEKYTLQEQQKFLKTFKRDYKQSKDEGRVVNFFVDTIDPYKHILSLDISTSGEWRSLPSKKDKESEKLALFNETIKGYSKLFSGWEEEKIDTLIKDIKEKCDLDNISYQEYKINLVKEVLLNDHDITLNDDQKDQIRTVTSFEELTELLNDFLDISYKLATDTSLLNIVQEFKDKKFKPVKDFFLKEEITVYLTSKEVRDIKNATSLDDLKEALSKYTLEGVITLDNIVETFKFKLDQSRLLVLFKEGFEASLKCDKKLSLEEVETILKARDRTVLEKSLQEKIIETLESSYGNSSSKNTFTTFLPKILKSSKTLESSHGSSSIKDTFTKIFHKEDSALSDPQFQMAIIQLKQYITENFEDSPPIAAAATAATAKEKTDALALLKNITTLGELKNNLNTILPELGCFDGSDTAMDVVQKFKETKYLKDKDELTKMLATKLNIAASYVDGDRTIESGFSEDEKTLIKESFSSVLEKVSNIKELAASLDCSPALNIETITDKFLKPILDKKRFIDYALDGTCTEEVQKMFDHIILSDQWVSYVANIDGGTTYTLTHLPEEDCDFEISVTDLGSGSKTVKGLNEVVDKKRKASEIFEDLLTTNSGDITIEHLDSLNDWLSIKVAKQKINPKTEYLGAKLDTLNKVIQQFINELTSKPVSEEHAEALTKLQYLVYNITVGSMGAKTNPPKTKEDIKQKVNTLLKAVEALKTKRVKREYIRDNTPVKSPIINCLRKCRGNLEAHLSPIKIIKQDIPSFKISSTEKGSYLYLCTTQQKKDDPKRQDIISQGFRESIISQLNKALPNFPIKVFPLKAIEDAEAAKLDVDEADLWLTNLIELVTLQEEKEELWDFFLYYFGQSLSDMQKEEMKDQLGSIPTIDEFSSFFSTIEGIIKEAPLTPSLTDEKKALLIKRLELKKACLGLNGLTSA